jgi:hypothetical protein
MKEDIIRIKSKLPSKGLFHEKEWRWSAQAFQLNSVQVQFLEDLGKILHEFLCTLDQLYLLGCNNEEYQWVTEWLDRGKPAWLVKLQRHTNWKGKTPKVIRPDLLITENGFQLTEIDSVPGGIGLLGWLNQQYSQLGQDIVGGLNGMIEHFEKNFKNTKILMSEEAVDYQPEMEWLCQQVNQRDEKGSLNFLNISCEKNWQNLIKNKSIYRFFELFDIDNVDGLRAWLFKAAEQGVEISAPPKSQLEEKMGMALFWHPRLRNFWQEHLSREAMEVLRKTIPYSWILQKERLASAQVYPEIGLHHWQELKTLTQRERRLILKISGYSPLAWGSRSVKVGHDLAAIEWAAAVDTAIEQGDHQPWILQRYAETQLVEHSYWNEKEEVVAKARWRARLCPYYFVDQAVTMQGILATLCPENKKIIHGMKEALILPCQRADKKT